MRTIRFPLCIVAVAALGGLGYALSGDAATGAEPVRLWQEPMAVPTYRLGPAETNPIFYHGRKYQGAKGAVYPYAMLDRLTDVREEVPYQALILENEFVRITVFPELGGRIFAATDKTNQYEFFYRQHVIKPALVGMAGAWISGGVEWNIPHHHRVTTFMPVDYRLVENADGSKTIWVGETERRHRMKWLVGMTLYPGRSYLEITTKLFNRTPLAHSMLCFANVAVHSGPDYQVIFPPSTEFGAQHAKREFLHWPLGQEVYHKLDRTGVDLSWWKNHPSPISIFAWNYRDDFVGGYDHGKQAGVVHVADHHLAPGKKFFTWGAGEEGRVWDKVLTETDGPYIELMAGAYSDNQPDYSWVAPNETRVVNEYWYPIRKLGGITNANLDAAVNLDIADGHTARLAVNTTTEVREARVVLQAARETLFQKTASIHPGQPFTAEVPLKEGTKPEDLRIAVFHGDRELIAYRPAKPRGEPMPAPVTPPPAPKDVKTVEELSLIALRLEQFHNPAIAPDPYYEEALRRDPHDTRANTALAILYCKRGRYAEADQLLRKALVRLTHHYTSPKDTEALYYLGVALDGQGRHDEADEAFYPATWGNAWSAAAYLRLAENACRKGNYSAALGFLDRSLNGNATSIKAWTLKALALRKLGHTDEALAAVQQTQRLDPLDFWSGNEALLIARECGQKDAAKKTQTDLAGRMRGQTESYLEVAADYAACGAWTEAIDVLTRFVAHTADKSRVMPMVYYDLAHACEQRGDAQQAARYRELAAKMPTDYCFPFRLESIEVLQRAIDANPRDARALYYLGNLLYDIQPRRAIGAWERSRELQPGFATVHRNLGLAYAYVQGDYAKGTASLTEAIACDPNDSLVFCEWDRIAEWAKVPREQRLAMLDKHAAAVAARDDTLLRHVSLCSLLGHYERALSLLSKHHFRRWEGENGPQTMYVDALLLRGQQHLAAGRHAEALQDFLAAQQYPENFETGRPLNGGDRAAKIHYLTGAAYEALARPSDAKQEWQKAARSESGWPEAWYYRGQAFRKLGQTSPADEQFAKLVRSGEDYLRNGWPPDFFGIFGTEPPEAVWKGDAHFRVALGLLGQGRPDEARRHLDEAAAFGMDHLGVQSHRAALGKP